VASSIAASDTGGHPPHCTSSGPRQYTHHWSSYSVPVQNLGPQPSVKWIASKHRHKYTQTEIRRIIVTLRYFRLHNCRVCVKQPHLQLIATTTIHYYESTLILNHVLWCNDDSPVLFFQRPELWGMMTCCRTCRWGPRPPCTSETWVPSWAGPW